MIGENKKNSSKNDCRETIIRAIITDEITKVALTVLQKLEIIITT